MKKRKNLLFICLSVLIFTIGFTLAFYTNKHHIESNFKVTAYGITVEKELDMPSDWKPGDSVDYNISVTNISDIDVAARIIVLPHWRGYVPVTTDGQMKEVYYSNYVDPGTYYDYYTKEEISHNGYNIVDLNFTNDDDWLQWGTDYSTGGKIYYYKHRLRPNQTSSNLIDSLTFNLAAGNLKCESVEDEVVDEYRSGTNLVHYESGYICSTGYNQNYTFVLHLWIQTVQYNQYQSVWRTSIEID